MRILTFLFMISTAVAAFAGNEDFVIRKDLPMTLENLSLDERSLKVMWWNVACSSTRGLKNLPDSEAFLVNPENQWKNLEELVSSERLRPEVLILGEYCPSAFKDETYRKIKSKYKYVYRLDKSNSLYKIRNGIRVFSKTKIRNIKEEVLSAESFVESDLMKNCPDNVKKRNPKSFGNKKYWNRPKISFTIEHNRKRYKIAPVHLANPWSFVKSCVGLWNTPGVIKNGEENANYIQAAQLVESFSDEESMILIGDFNAPKSILGGQSNSYRLLSKSFGQSVISSENYTYYDPRRNFPAYSIDHAFVSDDLNVEQGVVLPFAGSDHLPIYIIVDQ